MPANLVDRMAKVRRRVMPRTGAGDGTNRLPGVRGVDLRG